MVAILETITKPTKPIKHKTMKVNNWSIRWSYYINQIPLGKTMTPVKVTECNIYEGETVSYGLVGHFGTGKALCVTGDHFNKDKGRKLSLLRAMQDAGLPKGDRKQFWDVYRTTTKKPRW